MSGPEATMPARSRRSTALREQALVAGVALLSRLPYLCRTEQDLDGSRFVRGVMGFDVLHGHPHPPGYPVYVGAAIALDRALVHQPALALSLVSALGFAWLTALTYALGVRVGGGRVAGAVAALACALGTSVAVHSTRPLSDMLGAALAWAVVLCAIRAWHAAGTRDAVPTDTTHATARTSLRSALAGALLFGALGGTRPSVVPLCLPAFALCALCAWRARGLARFVLVATLAVLAWLVPLVALTGARALIAITRLHAEGHFGPRGITLAGESDPRARAASTLAGLWTHVLGGAWSDRPRTLWLWSLALVVLLPVGALALANAVRRAAPGARLVVGSAVLYTVWAFLGQNVVWQPRHLFPLAPALGLALGLGAGRVGAWVRPRGARYALGLALGVALATLAMEAHRVGRIQAREEPPALRVARFVDAHVPREGTVLVSTQLETWLRFRSPEHRTAWIADAGEALAIGRRTQLRVYATSEVPGIWSVRPQLRALFHALGDRYVYTALYDLALFELASPTEPGLAQRNNAHRVLDPLRTGRYTSEVVK